MLIQCNVSPTNLCMGENLSMKKDWQVNNPPVQDSCFSRPFEEISTVTFVKFYVNFICYLSGYKRRSLCNPSKCIRWEVSHNIRFHQLEVRREIHASSF